MSVTPSGYNSLVLDVILFVDDIEGLALVVRERHLRRWGHRRRATWVWLRVDGRKDLGSLASTILAERIVPPASDVWSRLFRAGVGVLLELGQRARRPSGVPHRQNLVKVEPLLRSLRGWCVHSRLVHDQVVLNVVHYREAAPSTSLAGRSRLARSPHTVRSLVDRILDEVGDLGHQLIGLHGRPMLDVLAACRATLGRERPLLGVDLSTLARVVEVRRIVLLKGPLGIVVHSLDALILEAWGAAYSVCCVAVTKGPITYATQDTVTPLVPRRCPEIVQLVHQQLQGPAHLRQLSLDL